ncbi:MAG: hypothetical protein IPK26_07990 [Planctomycetes bacterium]|nr:hypothetical protein [Planctomycetota bacterium]
MQPTLAFVLALASCHVLPGQGAQAPAPFSTTVGARTAIAGMAPTLVAHDGVLRASGRHYKAEFGEHLLFVPALGAAVEQNQPLRYRLSSIARDGQHILTADPIAALQREELRVSRRHSGTVTERFDVRPEGLEISYLFTSRPAGTGDLVVTADCLASLPCAVRADGTLAFVLPEIGGITISHVTGIDARGERVRGGLRWQDGKLEMSLPAAFVDRAAYPLVLDPLIGTEFQIGVNDDSDADVGYQHAVGLYLVAWKRRYSAFDHDIYAQFLSPAGVPQGAPIWFDSAADVAQRPRVGTVPSANRFVIVYEKSASPFGPFQVVCRTLETNGTIGVTTVVAPTTDNARHVAVGSEITNDDDDLLVVFETDAGIEAREVTVPPAGAPTVSAALALATTPLADEPEISRSGGLLGYWMVVWSGPINGNRELLATVVDRTRTMRTAFTLPFTANTVDDSHPAVDGDGSTFVCAYQSQEAPGSTLHDIRAIRLQFTGTAVNPVSPETPIEATPGQDERRPHTTWLGPKHCIVFEEQIATINTDIGAWLVEDTCALCNQKMSFDGLNPPGRNREFGPRVGGRWQFALNGVFDDGFLVFAEADDNPPFQSSIIAQQLQALGNGQAAVVVGPGCGNGGTSFVGGGSPFVIGSQYFTFYCSGLEAGAVPFLGLGFPSPPSACGPCSLLNAITFEFVPNIGGLATRPLPVTCNVAFVGLTLEFQWVSLFTSVSPCPSVNGLSASNRQQITLTN